MSAPVSELLALKFENSTLKLRAIQSDLRNLSNAFEQEKKLAQTLMVEMRAETGAGDGDPYDPTTRQFVPSEAKPEEVRKKPRRSNV